MTALTLKRKPPQLPSALSDRTRNHRAGEGTTAVFRATSVSKMKRDFYAEAEPTWKMGTASWGGRARSSFIRFP